MGVTCPACGSISRDIEFCDHCNADLVPRASPGPPERCTISAAESVLLNAEQLSELARPEASVVVVGRDGPWRAHWLPEDLRKASEISLAERLRNGARVLAPIRVNDEETGSWVLAKADGRPLRPWEDTVSEDPHEDLRALCRFVEKLARGLEELHEQQLVWLTFDPREIEEVGSFPEVAYLRITNLDLALYPARQIPEQLQALPGFTPPEVARFQAEEVGPTTDVYHLSLFAYYWLAGLLPDGFTGSGLESFAHEIPPLRVYRRDLPPGVTGVIHRGLAQEPRHRFPSPGAFCEALDKTLRRSEQRWRSTEAVSWEIGGHTRTGRAKEALDRDNEDHVLVRQFADPDRALVAVADGITTCEVGSGAIASLVTCVMLENEFDARSNRADFSSRIAAVCRRGSESLLAWALEQGYKKQLEQGMDLMGTTLLAGWLEDNMLTLANVGDSRAYLIDGGMIEQLTVDGDLGNELLASRLPPEEVRSLGIIARGLRDCVGGCTLNPRGELTILEDYFEPSLSQWPLLPGDVLVLCSDGLVEEGAYLEPETVAAIVRRGGQLSAEELAQKLADAADDRQRPPSEDEPDGFGDNITSIVIRVKRR